MLRAAVLLAVVAALLASGASADPRAGTVRGKVTVLKKKFFGGLAPSDDASGAIVYVTGYTEPPPADVAVLEQENERFVPRLLPIVAGQSVTFPNRDRFYHNVFSVSQVESFDLGQYKSTDPPRTQVFPKPGLVPVYCNIHPQMISYVVVLENRAYAVTGEDGTFELPNVHPGKIEVNAWLPGAQRASHTVELAPGGQLTLDLELSQTQVIPSHPRKDGTPYPPPPKYSGD